MKIKPQNQPSRLVRRTPRQLVLEQRFMFDGAAVADATATASASADFHATDAATNEQAQASVASFGDTRTNAQALPAAGREIVFIDAGISNLDKLLQGIPQGAEIVLVQTSEDGVMKMLSTLQGQKDIAAIHIIGHGEAGQETLGASTLNAATLEAYADRLATIGTSLRAGGDILLYGCDTGAGSQGTAFVERLGQLTGADVAASTDATGAAALGGNWILERTTGSIEAAAIRGDIYDGLLSAPVINIPDGTLLNFGTAVLQSGTDKAVGAVYKYTNVATVGGTQIDAWVTITGITNAVIGEIDSANPNSGTAYTLKNPDGTTVSLADNKLFAPTIKTTAAGGHVDFSITFKDTSGNPLTLSNFYNNSIDIDGKEFVEYGGFQSYEMSSPSDLNAVAGTGAQIRFTGTSDYNGLILNDGGRVQTRFDSVSTLTISMGATADTGTTFRQYGSIFAFHKYGASTIVTAPTVNTLVTNDTTPSITGTVGNSVLGGAEDFSVTVNGTTYSKGNAALTISGLTWTLNISAPMSDGAYDVTAKRGAALYDQTSHELTIDTTAPTATVTMDKSSLKAGDTATVTITFSEKIDQGSFTTGDLSVENGTLSNLATADGGQTWTATFTPTTGTEDTSNVIALKSASISDLAGNTNSAAESSPNYLVDTRRPVIDLDPSNSATLNHSASSNHGATVSLDDGADPASVAEGNGIATLTLSVSGLADGNDEKLLFGATTKRANGSESVGTVSVGGVMVDIAATGTSGAATGSFSIVKSGGGNLTATEVENIIRDLSYKNTQTTSATVGSRTFAFSATDAAGNTTAASAVSSIAVTHVDPLVSSPTVNEASPYAVFTVTGTAGQTFDLALTAGSATGGGTDYGDSGSTNLQYSTDGGATWTDYTWNGTTGDRPSVPGNGSILVRTPIVDDNLADNNETFALTVTPDNGSAITGTATIKDDGTGTVFNPDGTTDNSAPRDNDWLVSVSSPTVNEASPYAVFTVTGAAGQQIRLELQSTGSGTSHATLGTDTADAGAGVPLQYFDGTQWVDYTPTSYVTLGGASLLVRTAIANDAALEGPETFKLVATNNGGTTSTGGLGTIVDNGTGDYFAANNTSGTASVPPGATLDDDRSLAVSSPTVNEASPYAVFEISGSAGQLAVLALANGSANPASGDGVDYGLSAPGSDLQVSTDSGGTWSAYTAGSPIALNGSGKALVRVAIVNDAIADDNETFKLNATNAGGTVATGTATIKDDGTGTIFNDDGSDNTAAVRDDDRPIIVTGGTYNESSPRAIFTVDSDPGRILTFAVQDAATAGKQATSGLAAADLYCSLDGGASWALYSGSVTAGSQPILVAVDITAEHDRIFEGEEQLRLVVNAGLSAESGAYASILDDGTGIVTAPIDATTHGNTGGDNGTTRDDDRSAQPAPVAPPAVTPTPAPAVATGPAPVAPIQSPPVAPLPGQSFESTFGSPAGSPITSPLPGNQVAPVIQDMDALRATGQSGHIGDVYTSPTGFRVAVMEAPASSLMLFRGVADQYADTGSRSAFTVPYDAFAHTDPNERIALTASLADGRKLPPWVQFDASNGKFAFEAPPGFVGELKIKVSARDSRGDEVNTLFRFSVGQKLAATDGRSAFSEQLRLAGRPSQGARLLNVEARVMQLRGKAA